MPRKKKPTTENCLPKDNFGPRRGISSIVTEAISESTSYFLAIELAEKLGIERAREHANLAIEAYSKSERHLLVNNSINRMQTNGIQEAFNIYQDGLGKYLAEILN